MDYRLYNDAKRISFLQIIFLYLLNNFLKNKKKLKLYKKVLIEIKTIDQ